ncbi:HtaA domain-containing protein [Phenylobacterium sp.]|uniref:HtaA domain-containing protein n=1 Tax=Phenylobacterium sp. TaxID=1871053 RepID=UPI00301CE69B
MAIKRLIWGVKQSFRAYVEGSGGTIAVSDGAGRADDGTFAFEAADDSDLAFGADGTLSGVGRFRGQVAFKAHGGMLSVTLTDPWVEATDAGLVLSVAETAARRTAIAKLDTAALAPAADGTAELPAVITLDGMTIVGDHYPPGTPLDPVRLQG